MTTADSIVIELSDQMDSYQRDIRSAIRAHGLPRLRAKLQHAYSERAARSSRLSFGNQLADHSHSETVGIPYTFATTKLVVRQHFKDLADWHSFCYQEISYKLLIY